MYLHINILSLFLITTVVHDIQSIIIPFDLLSSNEEISNKFLSFLEYQSPVIIMNYMFILNVEIGNPPQKMKFKLSSRANGSWIMDKDIFNIGFKSTESNSLQLIHERMNDSFGEGIIVHDTLYIQGFDQRIQEFPFLIVQKSDIASTKQSVYEGEFNIGLEEYNQVPEASKYSFNLLDYLYDNKIISRPMITFNFHNKNQGSLTIGRYPSTVTDKKKLRECYAKRTDKKSASWSCFLNAIYFGDNKIFSVNNYVDFSIGGNTNMVSEVFFNFLVDNYFQKDIESQLCKKDNFGEYNGVCCKNEYDINKLGSISFVFGKWSLKVYFRDLFRVEVSGSRCLRIITSKKNKAWFISPSALVEYYTIYDKESKMIGFYPKDPYTDK